MNRPEGRLLLRRSVNPVPARSASGGPPLLALQDLEELGDVQVAVPEALLPLLFFLLDGTRDRAGVAEGWREATGWDIPPEALDGILARLDEALLLEGPRVEEARHRALAAYRARSARPMSHAPAAYPAEAEPLRRRLVEMREASGVQPPASPVHAVLAPHIDPRGGGPCHGAAVEALAASPAEVFVILGTAHRPIRRPFALTTLDFETPTGTLATDRDLVRRLARCGGGNLLDDERAHAAEHSVEFQASWIRALHGERPGLRIVPVLVGSLHDRILHGGSPMEDAPVRDFVEALRELRAELGDRVALVASVDFAHVGPNYGWSGAPDERALAAVMEEDRKLLERARAGDAEGWIRFLQAEKDVRSVCGAAPTYVFLQALAGSGLSGRVLRHDVWEIDPDTGSHVSFAAVAYAREGAAA